MQGLLPAINPWCNYSLCRHKSGSLITGALSTAGGRIFSFHCFLGKFFHRVKITPFCLLVQILCFCPRVSEQLLSPPSWLCQCLHWIHFTWIQKATIPFWEEKSSKSCKVQSSSWKANCWKRKHHNTLPLFLQFWMIPYHNHYCPLLQEISLNVGCEHSDTGTGSCTASAQPNFAPGYQHNVVTGTNYQCRNAGINKVHKLCIKSSWRIINLRASYSYQKIRVYTAKIFLKCHMRLQ